MLSPEELKPNVLQNFEQLNRDGYWTGEFDVKRKDGSTIPTRISNTYLKDKNGKNIGYIGISYEISSLREAEKILAESEEKYRNLFNNAEVAIFRTKLDGSEYLDVNEKFLSIIGFTRAELKGRSPIMNWAVPSQRIELISILKEKGKVENFPWKLLTKNGDIRMCVTSLKMYPEKGILEGSFIDITDQIYYKEKLEESEHKYTTLFNRVSNGIFVYDLETMEILDVNESISRIYGYKRDEFIGMNCLNLSAEVEKSKSAGQAIKEGVDINVHYRNHRKKNGELLIVDLNGYHAIVDKKEIGFAVVRDVTEQNNREQTIQQNVLLMDSLFEASKPILNNDDFTVSARYIFDKCRHLINAKTGYVTLLSDSSDNNVLFLESGGLPCEVDANLPMPIRGLREQAYKTGKVVYDNDFLNSEWQEFLPPGHVTIKNVLFIPLNLDDKTVGIIGLANKPSHFVDKDKLIAEAFGDLMSIALRNSRMRNLLEENQKQYSNLFKYMPSAFAFNKVIYENGNPVDFIFLNVNEAFEKITGLNNVIGKRDSEVVKGIQQTDKEMFEIVGRVASTGKPERLDYYVNALDR